MAKPAAEAADKDTHSFKYKATNGFIQYKSNKSKEADTLQYRVVAAQHSLHSAVPKTTCILFIHSTYTAYRLLYQNTHVRALYY